MDAADRPPTAASGRLRRFGAPGTAARPPTTASARLRRFGAPGTAGLVFAGPVTAGLMLGGLVLGSREPGAADRALAGHLHGGPGSAQVVVAQVLTRVGVGVLLVAVLVFAGLLLRARFVGWVRRGGWAPVAIPILAALCAGLASSVIKLVVGRARPPSEGWFASANGSSFPSGHTTAATAGYLALALVVVATAASRAVRIGALAAGVAMSVAIGWTRLALGVHWPTDVLAGWLLGAAAAAGVVACWARTSQPWTGRPRRG